MTALSRTARFELNNPYAKYGLKRRPTFEEIVGLISDDKKALQPLPNREATRFRNSPQGSFFDGSDAMELLKEQQNRILDRQMRDTILRRQSQTNRQTYHLERHIGGETGSNSTSVVDEFGTALNTARGQGSGMDAETSMREQAELRRQEQTSQSFGQRLQERAQTLMSSFIKPKAEVHTISSDEEFVDSQGQEVFARQPQPQTPPSLPMPPHREEINYTNNMDFWDSQTVDYLQYQLFLRNVRFKEEDKFNGRDYKKYLLELVGDEMIQGSWTDPVSDEMYEKRRREWAFRNKSKSKSQSLSSSVAEGAKEGAKAVAKAAVVKGGEMLVKKAFGV